jgi:cephalosporin hydroxylase
MNTWEPRPYYDVYKEHKGYTAHKEIQYFFIYDKIFAPYLQKGKPVTLLEIGVQNGGSLEIWGKYLPPGSEIHGVDINEKCLDLKFDASIRFHLGSAADNDFMNKAFQNIEFDVILDDGSHKCSDVIKTFKNMFPKISGGIYIVEDLHASYWSKFGGGFRRRKSSVEYFKRLVEEVNRDYVGINMRKITYSRLHLQHFFNKSRLKSLQDLCLKVLALLHKIDSDDI